MFHVPHCMYVSIRGMHICPACDAIQHCIAALTYADPTCMHNIWHLPIKITAHPCYTMYSIQTQNVYLQLLLLDHDFSLSQGSVTCRCYARYHAKDTMLLKLIKS